MQKFFVVISMIVIQGFHASAQPFIHPGLDQTRSDLEYMKDQVSEGKEPWIGAFERLKAKTNLKEEIEPFTYVLRGAYGKPNIGGTALSESAELAYNCAVLWYLTDDKLYADKAIEVLNAWSGSLWNFDYNDAKLLAGWTGHVLCNAAEILKYTESGWKEQDIEQFSDMLLTVYYPFLRGYLPRANGNWDGAIVHSVIAIAVFTDNRQMFDNAIDHLLHSRLNGSIFKYIYPSGQCQESIRDQGHVQLGLGEFAGAAQIAYTQGVDLFSLGNYRIALGYEYTAQFLTGDPPHAYGTISERATELRDIYEYVYRHHDRLGIDLPYTKKAADLMRPNVARSVLTAFRAPGNEKSAAISTPEPSKIAYPTGALDHSQAKPPSNAVHVAPGQSLQKALDEASGKSGWVVADAGVHVLPTTLTMPSNVTLSGEGLKTILILDPQSSVRDAVKNGSPDMHNVTISDLVIEGALKVEPGRDPNATRSFKDQYNRGGILFLGEAKGQIKNINLENLTVKNCTYSGVFISGASGVNIINCDFNENGASVVPGPRLMHNLSLAHSTNIQVRNCRLDTSPFGCGVAISKCDEAVISASEIARNGWHGILISESKNIKINDNLIEANDSNGIMVEYLFRGSQNIQANDNFIQFNSDCGIQSYAATDVQSNGNSYSWNGNAAEQQTTIYRTQ